MKNLINYENIYKLFTNKVLVLDKSLESFSKEINNSIPNSFGVYIFYKNFKSYENIIYIGKAGEFTTFGEKKEQGLQKRLTNLRDKKTANIYYKDIFNFFNIEKIILEYFETDENYIPAYIEACLIQEYFSKYNKLPTLNKSF